MDTYCSTMQQQWQSTINSIMYEAPKTTTNAIMETLKSRTSKADSTLEFTFTNVTRVQACNRRSIGDRGIPLHFSDIVMSAQLMLMAHHVCAASRDNTLVDTSCCACIRSQRCVSKSRIRPKTIRSQLRCDRRELQLPKGRQPKEVAEGLAQYRPRRRCIHCAKGVLLLQVLGLSKVVLLLHETGETRPHRQQMRAEVEGVLVLHEQRHRKHGHHRHRMNRGCRRQTRQSIQRQRNPRDELLQHLVAPHDVNLRGWDSSS